MSSTYQGLASLTGIAGADFTSSLYLLGQFGAGGVFSIVAGAGQVPDGQIGEEVAQGVAFPVIPPNAGLTKFKTGAAVAAGALLEVDAAGKVITHTTGHIVGRAHQAAAGADEVIEGQFFLAGKTA